MQVVQMACKLDAINRVIQRKFLFVVINLRRLSPRTSLFIIKHNVPGSHSAAEIEYSELLSNPVMKTAERMKLFSRKNVGTNLFPMNDKCTRQKQSGKIRRPRFH